MARCIAPVNGHRSASARENCPVCGGRGRYSSCNSYSSPYSSYSTSSINLGNSGGQSRTKAGWSSAGSTNDFYFILTQTNQLINHYRFHQDLCRKLCICLISYE